MKTAQTIIIDNSNPFGIRDKIGYAFGDLGNNLTFNLVNTFLMIFYTNVLGLSGTAVGILFLVARFIDAVADVTVGRLTDNSKLTSIGRFKPWIQRMKYFLLVAAILLFIPIVKDFPMGLRLLYVFITYLAFGIFYSTVNIPYGSMASAISNDPNDKTALSTFRSIGAAMGSALVSYIVPIFMYVGTTGEISGNRTFIIVAICAFLGFLSYIVTCQMTTERVRSEKSQPVPLNVMLIDMLKNKALVVLVIVDIIMVITQNLSGTTISYLFNDYFKNKVAMSVALVMNYIVVLMLAPFAGYLTKKFGRKEITVFSMFVGAILYTILLLLHTHNAVVFIIIWALGALGIGMFNLMVWAFITDVIDNQQVISGVREDGLVYGVNSFSRKVAQAIAGGFGGIMLTLIGYVSSSTGGVAQTNVVINHIYTMTAGIPAACAWTAAFVLLFAYPLNKKRVQENVKILQQEIKR
ncbi:MFS transporter [Liquorilactobacillus satsumensis]|uniref:MFS transporter n=1 Tax=Liquorilactobacillus TaxID=2767888 RepID=UPI0021C319F1|nr:MFS transporter [Liquorilactobacillus satsumensis]